MTYGEMVENLIKFKLGEGEGRFLRDVDPETADALNSFWDCFGPHGSCTSGSSIFDLCEHVEIGLQGERLGGTPIYLDELAELGNKYHASFEKAVELATNGGKEVEELQKRLENSERIVSQIETEILTCEFCGSEENVEYTLDPYGYEIDNDQEPHYVCKKCIEDRSDDI